MRILGVHGAHDSSVCIINDGEVELFLKEERLSVEKRDSWPFKSLFSVINSNKEKIDYICYSATPGNSYNSLVNLFDKFFDCPKICYDDKHHLSHASSAFYNSGFEESLVFVIDRNGSVINYAMRESETVFQVSYPCNFKELHKNYWQFKISDWNPMIIKEIERLKKNKTSYSVGNFMSIVKIYESATTLIGQNPLENGKTMGLASYGNQGNFINLFSGNLPNDSLFIESHLLPTNIPGYINMPTTLLREYCNKITTKVTKENYQFYADYAYQVQKQTQEHTLKFIKEWVDKTGIKNVCIVGGYGLNVVANGYFVENLPDVNFFFEPLADDTGQSIGMAMHKYRELTGDTTIHKMNTTSTHGYKQELIDVGINCNIDDIVELLNQQKVVAVFNGLAESGPRALGNRSILFDARNKEGKDIVNRIKKREWYRPFAGMVLKEDFSKYFYNLGLESSEYMTISFDTKLPELIPSVVHVDNSCRVQTVDKSIPHIFDLLTKFKEKTGSSVLLNTSFNLAGKPLIETQQQAIDTFNNSEIDVLWFPEINRMIIK